MFIVGLAFRLKPGQALKSAIRIGIGLFGLSMMTEVAIKYFTPIANALTSRIGLQYPIIDSGVGVEILVAWSFKHAAFIIPAGILLNIVLLTIKFTKTVNVDIWNFWPWLLSAQLVYTITDSYVWAWVALLATGILSLKLGDIQAPKMQKVYGLPGVSFAHPFSTVYALLAPVFNKLFDAIGLDKIKADPESLQEKLGVMGDSTTIGALMGFILSLIGGFGFGQALTNAMIFAAVIILFPQVVGYLVEGLVPISTAARTFLMKRYAGREYYIGLDCAIGVGQPANMVVQAFFIPILFILSAILPGVAILPAGCVAIHGAFMMSGAMPYFNKNIVKGLIYCTIMLIPALYAATWAAPYLTDSYVAAGGAMPEGSNIVGCAVPYLWSNIMAFIAKLFS